MADNKTVDNGGLTDYPVATDEVTYSGDTADVQLMRPVHVTGAEGAKTVVDVTADLGSGVGSVFVTPTDAFLNQQIFTANGEALVAPATYMGTDTYSEGNDAGLLIAAIRRDADTTLVNTTNEYAPLQVDANGRLKVEVFSGETLPVSLTSTTITGTVAVTDNSGSITVDAPSGTPVAVRIGDGTLQASVVDETGSSAVDALAVGGGTPHDSVDSGNPLKVGMKAANALPTAVANNDRANAIGDLFGRQMVTHIDPAMQVWKSYNDTSSRGAGSAQVVWDPTGGKKIAITSYVVSAYGTTAGRIFLFFGDDADLTYTAGTDQPLLVASYAPSTNSKPGTVWTGNVPIFCVTADRRLHYQNDAAISVDITIYGYEF